MVKTTVDATVTGAWHEPSAHDPPACRSRSNACAKMETSVTPTPRETQQASRWRRDQTPGHS
eukprot:3903556-Alexandrium_andersonii.AAC.1